MVNQQLSTNTFCEAKWLVDATAGQGTHTTIAAALTASSSGDTIFIRPGTYTENLTLKAGVNLTAYGSDSSLNATGKVIISGTCTLTTAGSVTISGIQLQTNSAFLLAVTGTLASVVNLNNCYLNCTNNTGITFTSSSASSSIFMFNCTGNLGTTGITYWVSTASGALNVQNCGFANSGASSTASSNSALSVTIAFSTLGFPLSCSSTGILIIYNSVIDSSATNSTSITTAGSGISVIYSTTISSGSASCISAGTGTTVGFSDGTIISSNTNSITGAGTISYGNISLAGTSKIINTTTQSNVNSSTFTPTLAFGGASVGITYSTRTGHYYRSGNVVFITIVITLTSKGSSVGTATISGLPFTSAAAPAVYEFFSAYINMTAATATYWSTELGASVSSMTPVFGVAATGGFNATSDTNWQNGSIARIQGFYFI